PHVALRWRDLALSGKAQLEKSLHAGATPFQCGNQSPARDSAVIDASRRCGAVLPPKRLKPHTSRVVKVSRAGQDCSLGPGNGKVPKLRRKALDKLHCDLVIGSPGCEHAPFQKAGIGLSGSSGNSKIVLWRHTKLLLTQTRAPGVHGSNFFLRKFE